MIDSLIYTGTEAATNWIKYAEYVRATPGLKFGVRRLDETILPLRRGKILAILARPGHGKSTLAAFLARKEAQEIAAEQRKENVFYVTLDQPIEEIETIINSDSGLTVSDIAWGRADIEAMRVRSLKRVRLPLDYVGKSAYEHRKNKPFTFRNIFADIKTETERRGVKTSLIVLDYIQKFHVAEKERRQDEVTEAIFAARELCLELQCKMIVCVQASRESEKGEGKIPRSHHCQHASAIEQEADAILGLWRPVKTETTNEVQVTIEGKKQVYPIVPELMFMRLDKQRMGEAGIDYAVWLDPNLVRLAEMEVNQ
ncbi:MAG: AAA family ATPase [Blastocatellia bacterium]|nr:AAA family ATPase [Blastocatellia bacterium]